MHGHRILVLAIVLLLVGAGGIAAVMIATPRPATNLSSSAPPSLRPGRPGTGAGVPTTASSLGESIFLDGIGENGRTVPRSAVGPGMMGGGCAQCHGADGKGASIRMMMTTIEAPDIRYSTLTSVHENGKEPAWTDAQIRKAITDGVDADNNDLEPYMPRWSLTDRELDAVISYLKELSRQ